MIPRFYTRIVSDHNSQLKNISLLLSPSFSRIMQSTSYTLLLFLACRSCKSFHVCLSKVNGTSGNGASLSIWENIMLCSPWWLICVSAVKSYSHSVTAFPAQGHSVSWECWGCYTSPLALMLIFYSEGRRCHALSIYIFNFFNGKGFCDGALIITSMGLLSIDLMHLFSM